MSGEAQLDVVMPQMGVSVSEGTITRWLRNVGDTVSADESLLEISTDKVDTEVPSPGGGILREILVEEGETVAVGTVLARIDGATPQERSPGAAAPEAARRAESLAAPPERVAEQPEPGTQPAGAPEPGPQREEGAGDQNAPPGHSFVSPVVARIASAHGLDLTTIEGSGPGGRVTKKDLPAFVEAESGAAPAPSDPESGPPGPASPEGASTSGSPRGGAPQAAAPPSRTPTDGAAREAAASAAPPTPPRRVQTAPEPSGATRPLEPGESLESMSAMRRGIADHMRRSLDTAAHVTSAIEVDMSRVAAIRERIKHDFTSSYGVNPTYLSFVARATVDTLRDWPWINAELRAEGILTRTHVNLGFAVALEGGKGLIVPVLKHAEGLNLLGMARGIADLAERARTRKLLPDDVQGGTFTITNPGSFGTLFGTPIINQPQSAILGTYAIVKRPWVIADDGGQDAIAIRSIMNLTLTYDHRLVDGAYGAQFLRDLAGRLESWGEADY